MKGKGKVKFFYRAGNEPRRTLKRWIQTSVLIGERLGGTVATDDSVATDGGAGVARACVEKIPIDTPTPVKMPNGGIDMLGCVG